MALTPEDLAALRDLVREESAAAVTAALADHATRANSEESRVVRDLTGMKAQLGAIEARLGSLETRIGTLNLVDDGTLARFASQAAHQAISEHIARHH